MITSNSNSQVKNLIQLSKKAKARKNQGLFVIEGKKLYEEIPEGWLEQTYVSESFLTEESNRAMLVGRAYEVLSDSVFGTVADTMTPQGILALVRMPEYSLDSLLAGERTHLLITEGIQDPGNLGTMFRTGEGAGITGVIVSRTTVDVYNPKTVRSTMGSIFRVPFLVAENLEETIGALKAAGVKLYAAHLRGTCSYDEPDYKQATGFLIGTEGNGLTEETAELADTYIRIPMEGKVESLNAAIAATLLMYEVNRQRR